MFFVSVDSKEFSDPVSSLVATLTEDFISVDSSRLRRAKGQRSSRLRDGEWRRARGKEGAEFLA